jgi:hypothetical protein
MIKPRWWMLLAALIPTSLIVTSFIAPARAGGELKLIKLDINTNADEIDPHVTADGLTLYWAANKQGTFDIHVAKRASAQQSWKLSKPVVFSPEADDRSPFLFKEDLYFATNHIPDEKLKDLRNFDIFKKTGERAPIPLIGISEKEDELHPWLTPQGREFYFSRKTKEGLVLMVAAGPRPGPIGDAKEVGFPPGFCHATLNAAGTLMYLQGPLDKERTGIFRSKRAKLTVPWSAPAPVAALEQGAGKRDASPCLSGERLYFASDRAGGKGGMDIWAVPLYQLK